MFFEEIKIKVIQALRWMNEQADAKDVKRNHTNYGSVQAYAYVLRQMGHTTELNNAWEDENGCLRIAKASIDGESLDF